MNPIIVHDQQPISLRHELGIMFGFLAACVLTVTIYYIFWQASQHRAALRDEQRRKDLRARGFHHERGGYHDKALHRYASRDPIAQTQGLTLEFLTEPAQYQAMMMGGGSNNNSNIDSSNRADEGYTHFDEDAIGYATTSDNNINKNDNKNVNNNSGDGYMSHAHTEETESPSQSQSSSSPPVGAGTGAGAAGSGLRMNSSEYLHNSFDKFDKNTSAGSDGARASADAASSRMPSSGSMRAGVGQKANDLF